MQKGPFVGERPVKESYSLARLLHKIAPRIGAEVLVEPEWGIVGRIKFKNGKISYFRYTTLDLNPVGASDIAKDKDYANYFMRELGYPTIRGKTFFSVSWAKAIKAKGRGVTDAYEYAESLGFPVVVKPNSGSQGRGVMVVHTQREFYAAMAEIFKSDKVAIVQERVSGHDYRIVVLDDKIISAYERIPLSVTGDGTSTVRELLVAKQNQFDRDGRDTKIKLDDPRIREKLIRQNLSFDSRPAIGVNIPLLDNANLSTGGDAIDVTRDVHPDFVKIAIKLTKDMGLRLCGVDLMVPNGIQSPAAKYSVLEINAAPGLDHYAKVGKEQEQIVEDLYLEVLKSIERGS